MAMMFTNLGIQALLNRGIKGSFPNGGDDFALRLYTNTHTLASTDTSAQLTEAAGGDYAAKTLAASGFTIAFTGSIYTASFAVQSFVFSGPLTTNPNCVGYYITDANGTVWIEEAFASSFSPFNNGDALPIVPTIQGSHGTPVA